MKGIKTDIGGLLFYIGMIILGADLLYIVNVAWSGRLSDIIIYSIAFFAGITCLHNGENMLKASRKRQTPKRRKKQTGAQRFAA